MTNNEEIDPLQEILHAGARKLLASAVEAEVEYFLAQHQQNSESTGKANGCS